MKFYKKNIGGNVITDPTPWPFKISGYGTARLQLTMRRSPQPCLLWRCPTRQLFNTIFP